MGVSYFRVERNYRTGFRKKATSASKPKRRPRRNRRISESGRSARMTRLAENKHTSNFPRSGRPWLEQLRQEGIDRFDEVGFPSTKQEEWRFTNVAPIAKIPFKHVPENPDT